MTKFKKGQLISYYVDSYGKCLGIFDRQEGYRVYAYWQKYDGGKNYLNKFNTYLDWMYESVVTPETDWSQIDGFENIPDFALVPRPDVEKETKLTCTNIHKCSDGLGFTEGKIIVDDIEYTPEELDEEIRTLRRAKARYNKHFK